MPIATPTVNAANDSRYFDSSNKQYSPLFFYIHSEALQAYLHVAIGTAKLVPWIFIYSVEIPFLDSISHHEHRFLMESVNNGNLVM